MCTLASTYARSSVEQFPDLVTFPRKMLNIEGKVALLQKKLEEIRSMEELEQKKPATRITCYFPSFNSLIY